MPKSRQIFAILLAVLTMVSASAAQAMDRVYQTPEDFIAEVFPAKPQPKVVWLTKDVQTEVARILGHAPAMLHQHYWSEGNRTLWILEEVGKEDKITAGFVIKEGRIEQAKVLVYRESRGMEIHYPAFLNQFRGVALSGGSQLDHSIDGISGATLSVHAMERMARLALYFDQLSRTK